MVGPQKKIRLSMVLVGASLGSCLVGFSSSAIGPTLNQPGWYSTMGLAMDPTDPDHSYTTQVISAANGVFYAGAFFGTVSIAWPAEKWGRLRAFQIGALFHILGGILQSAAVNVPMYLVARLISGFAVGLGTGIMTTYYSELALPTRRGLLGGLHGLGIELGALVCGWIALGCYYSSNSSFAWRFPVSLICLLALVLLIVSFFLPETPRWLIRHGRADEALHVLEALHHTPNDPNIGHREFQQIEMQLREEQVQFQTYGKWQLFTDRHYLTRLFRACGLVLFIQSNGILLIYNYSSIIYSTLGLGPSQALALLAGWISWTAVCIYTGNMLSDKFSRKKVIMAGFVGCCTFLSIYMAALSQYLETGATKWAAVSVVFIFLDVIPFGACLANNCFTVPTELFPNHLRTWAACIAISCTYLIQVLWLNVGPLALTNVSWKFYSVFIACGFCGIFYVFFFIPNTSGIPLEEIDTLFGRQVAVKLDDIKADGTITGAQGDISDVHSIQMKAE